MPQSWSLLGLAEAAAQRARADLSLEWLATALEIFEGLAQSEGGRRGESHLLAAMHLRAYFLKALATDTIHDLLSVQPLVDWFRDRVDLPQDEILQKTMKWEDLPVNDILKLRDLKNRIAVFEQLAATSYLNEYEDIRQWLSLRSQLP
jgi:hypothetical protein